MTEQTNGFIEQSDDAAVYAANLLRYYSFELSGYTVEQLLTEWLNHYPVNWVRMAIVEALYQGRYKAVSVEQILAFWQRRGQPVHHFNYEFDRLVCNKFPRNLAPAVDLAPALVPARSETLRSLKAREILREAQRSHPLLGVRGPSEPEENAETLNPVASIVDNPPPAIEPAADPVSADADSTLVSQRLERLEMLKPMPADLPTQKLNGHSSPAELGQAAIVTSASTEIGNRRQDCNAAPLSSRLATITEHLHRWSDPLLKPDQEAFPNLELAPSPSASQPAPEQTAPYQPAWLSAHEGKAPIHQFVPNLKRSEFHEKLKAVAYPPSEELFWQQPSVQPAEPPPNRC